MVFLHAFITSGRAGGRGKDGKTIISGHVFGWAGGRADRLPKLFLDTSSTKLFLGTSPGGRAGGRADKLPKLFLDTSSAKLFLGTSPGGRAGGQAGKVISGRVLLFLDASWYFCTRSSRAGGRAGGRAREGWQNYFWTRLWVGGRAGGQTAKVISGHVFRKIISGHVSGRAGGRAGEERLPKLLRFAWQVQDFGSFLFEKLRRPRTKCSFWKFVP